MVNDINLKVMLSAVKENEAGKGSDGFSTCTEWGGAFMLGQSRSDFPNSEVLF